MRDYGIPNMGGSTISTKITRKMITELSEGRFSTVDKLPSELELAEAYKVSRSVIRDVMSSLEQLGFVERVRGIGTVVHREVVKLQTRFDMKFEYNELLQNLGYDARVDHVAVEKKTVSPEIAKRLQIGSEEPVLVCTKRVLADKTPVIYSINHIPFKIFASVDYETVKWSEPVFQILEGLFGILVDTSITKVRGVNPSNEIKSLLELDETEATLLVDEVSYYKLSVPILHTYAYYTSFFDFSLTRKRF